MVDCYGIFFLSKEGISWEGHLGWIYLSGLFLAFVLKTDIPPCTQICMGRMKSIKEEEDDFMKHFDEEGNFIENGNL